MSSRAEQETVIRWDEESDTVDVWTASPVVARKMARLGFAATSTGVRNGDNGSWTYKIPSAMWRWSFRPKSARAGNAAALAKANAARRKAALGDETQPVVVGLEPISQSLVVNGRVSR